MSKQHYIVNCYTCQHNGQETCKGCRTLLVGEDEPYENWQLREDLDEKDKRIRELEEQLAITKKTLEMACKRANFCPHPYESVCKCVGKKCEDCRLEYLMSIAKELQDEV